jgi:hypothetical protein
VQQKAAVRVSGNEPTTSLRDVMIGGFGLDAFPGAERYLLLVNWPRPLMAGAIFVPMMIADAQKTAKT